MYIFGNEFNVNPDLIKEINNLNNNQNGKIYFCVNDDVNRIKLNNTEECINLLNYLINKLDLSSSTSIHLLKEDDKNIIVLKVTKEINKKQEVPTPPQEVINPTNVTFEDKLSSYQNLEFYETQKISKLRTLSFDLDKIANKDKKYKNLGLILSDQSPFSIIVNDYYNKTIDQNTRRVYSGSILKVINEVFEFIDKKNLKTYILDNQPKNEVEDYCLKEIKEIIINAVIHRDYELQGNITINIFYDHLEISSPGTLCSGYTLKDILNGMCINRNPKLAEIIKLFYPEYFNKLSIKKITEKYKNEPNKPEFMLVDKMFYTVFYKKNHEIELSMETRVYNHILRHNRISKTDIMNDFHLTESSCKKILRSLVKKNLVKESSESVYYV